MEGNPAVAWSTRQVAELAGTTVKAVRHYHKLGLLEEPERGSNGYKRYGVDHLVRLLRIRRLTDLGVSLAQIAALGDADEHPDEALRSLDAELAATVDRLQRVRAELALILKQRLPTDLPPELAAASSRLTEAERALTVVYSRILGPDGIEAYGRMLAEYPRVPVAVEFDELPEDADEETRKDLARRFSSHTIDLYRTHPDVFTAPLEAPGGARHATTTIQLALSDVYNSAQLDVLDRVAHSFSRRLEAERATESLRRSEPPSPAGGRTPA
jgi:DNA-binding transcriptional MerR regulator